MCGYSNSLDLQGYGKQGFQQAAKPDSFIVEGVGAVGTVQNERKLGYYEVVLSGHMIPQFVPWVRFPEFYPLHYSREADHSPFQKAAFQSMQWLLGIRQYP